MLAVWVVFLPLVASLLAGFGGSVLRARGCEIVTTAAVGLACFFSWRLFFDLNFGGEAYQIYLADWVQLAQLRFEWALRIDQLTTVMLVVVTTISALVHLYAMGYMAHDGSRPRFMAYLSFFTFAMLMLVTADNLVQLFLGWEGVGLASYLLIGFWYKKPSANAAAMKAFIVNRVGDIGFGLGICVLYAAGGSVHFETLFQLGPVLAEQSLGWGGLSVLDLACLLLFIGAMGKSAQLGLHTWLPDAMEGPTPVSALIHAATMVTAGVFMVCRLSPLFEYSETALGVITFVGATTALFAATIGLTQNDIKRVIAYSTCSQLGYMFFAIGVSAYPAAMFHLFTHAFFKALLFLGAGSVIHAMSDEQDLRRMGGIRIWVPLTYVLMFIGSLSLVGLPPFAGFYSKDFVLEAAFAAHTSVGLYAFWLGIVTALLTALYSWRLLIMAFHAPARASEHVMSRVRESDWFITIPNIVLAVGALSAGFLFKDGFIGDSMSEFWGNTLLVLDYHNAMEDAHHVPLWVKWLPVGAGLAGIGLAYWIWHFSKTRAPFLSKHLAPLYLLFHNKWYVDELYHFLFIRPSLALGRFFWHRVDDGVINPYGPDGLAWLSRWVARVFSRLQTGYIYHYVLLFLLGLTGLLALFVR